MFVICETPFWASVIPSTHPGRQGQFQSFVYNIQHCAHKTKSTLVFFLVNANPTLQSNHLCAVLATFQWLVTTKANPTEPNNQAVRIGSNAEVVGTYRASE
jgi:hypothetical protein